MKTTLGLMYAVAPMVAWVAAAEPGVSTATVAENLQKLVEIMKRDGALPDSKYLSKYEKRGVVKFLREVELCSNGERPVQEVEWFSAVRDLYYTFSREKVQNVRELYVLLLKAGASPLTESAFEAFFGAEFSKDPEIIDLLMKMADPKKVNPRTKFGLLHGAAMSGNAELVKRLLAAGADPNARGRAWFSTPEDELSGVSVLQVAVADCGQPEIVRMLLDAGADVNSLLKVKDTPARSFIDMVVLNAVLRANGKDRKELLELLLERGCKPASVPHIMVDCILGNTEALPQYLDGKPDLNKPLPIEGLRGAKVTLLEYAVRCQQKEICAALLAAGADVNTLAQPGDASLLCLAALMGDAELCRILVDAGAKIIYDEEEGNVPLLCALLCDDAEKRQAVVDLFKEKGADMKAMRDIIRDALTRNDDGVSAWKYTLIRKFDTLQSAIQLGLVDKEIADSLLTSAAGMSEIVRDTPAIVRCLLELGANPDGVSSDTIGRYHHPLLSAIANGNAETVKLLLAAGADVSISEKGETPISVAIGRERFDILRQLIAAKADLNAADRNGDVPLTLAARAGRFDICELLIDAGAELDDEEDTGAKVFAKALSSSNAELCRKLYDAGLPAARRIVPLCRAAMLGQVDELKELLAKTPNVKARYKGRSALTYAAHMGQTEAVRLLLAAGADVNVQDREGWTPLLAAASAGRVELVKELIAAGADVNPSESGRSVLLAAILSEQKETALALIAAGADVKAADRRNGSTALHYAVEFFTDSKLVDTLIAAGADVNAKDERGITPLHLYFLTRDEPTMDDLVCRKLIAAGADVNAKDEAGKKPEDYVSTLVSYGSHSPLTF